MDAPANAMLDRLLALGESGVPVLRATLRELERLDRARERIASADLANAILRDPLMTLRVLSYLHEHRTKSQTHDITTIAHAIMMLGLDRFFRAFEAIAPIEDALADAPEAITTVHAAASRMRLAALFARDWAAHRHDVDPEEVMVAALVHDVIELLAACAWRGPAVVAAEQSAQLRSALFARLGLPGLLAELTGDADSAHPRVANVALACALARCCEHGWNEPCLADALERVQRWLHVPEGDLWVRVRRVALLAAKEWRYYGTRPAAAYLPIQAPAVPIGCGDMQPPGGRSLPDRSSDATDRR